MAVLTAAVVLLGAWVIYDLATETALPGDIEQTVDEYFRGWEEQDEAALRALVTGDFRDVTHIFEMGIGSQQGRLLLTARYSNNIEGVVREGLSNAWQIERIGQPAVSGDGPWFVAVEEHWTKCAIVGQTTDECSAFVRYLGTGMFAIVEEDGSLKVADHTWVGLLEK